MKMCDYGCGQESKHQLKNGKFCCSKSWNSCPGTKRKKSKKMTGRTKETHEGVRRAAEKKRGKTYIELYGEEKANQLKDNHSKKMKGKKTGPRTEDQKRNISKGSIGKNKGKRYSKEVNMKKGRKGISSPKKNKTLEELYGKEKASEIKEKLKKWMKSGHAAYMNKFIQNPSKEELKLRTLCQKVLPYVEPNYPVYRIGKGRRSYNIDNAVPKLNLAIEFDGYFHFCDEEHIKYHRKRQKDLEEEGWKFLRYDIFHLFPSLEQLKKDIQELLNSKD
jgi:hypothetical protein